MVDCLLWLVSNLLGEGSWRAGKWGTTPRLTMQCRDCQRQGGQETLRDVRWGLSGGCGFLELSLPSVPSPLQDGLGGSCRSPSRAPSTHRAALIA